MKIDDFIQTIGKRGGVAKANRFKIIVGGIRTNLNVPGYNSNDLSFLCESVVLPGRNVATSDYIVGRQSLKSPYTFINSEVTATFLMTADFMPRAFFSAWQNAVLNNSTFQVGYKSDYTTDISIIQTSSQDENDSANFRVKLLKAFPTSIGESTLSNGDTEAVRMTVTFAYDNFEEYLN